MWGMEPDTEQLVLVGRVSSEVVLRCCLRGLLNQISFVVLLCGWHHSGLVDGDKSHARKYTPNRNRSMGNVVKHALLYSGELELSNGTTLIFVSPLLDNLQPHLICRMYVSRLVQPQKSKVVYQMTFHNIP